MNQFNKEIAQALLENTNLTEVFRNQLESTMNSLLESELTAILGYDPYVRALITETIAMAITPDD